MSETNQQDRPILFFHRGEQDREAYIAVLHSGIPCDFRAAAEDPTPMLLVGYQRFLGIDEIRRFILESNQRGRP